MHMEPITDGCITLTNVQHKPIEYDADYPDPPEVDYYPEFIVTGTITIDGQARDFKRSVSLELDGRDAEESHIEGFDWGADEHIGTPLFDAIDCGQISEDLYNAIYASEAYQAAARAFHGIEEGA